MKDIKNERNIIEMLKKIIERFLPTNLARGIVKTKIKIIKIKLTKPKLKKYKFSGLINFGNQFEETKNKNEIKGITISTLLKKEAITFVFLSLIVSSDKVKFFLSISFEI